MLRSPLLLRLAVLLVGVCALGGHLPAGAQERAPNIVLLIGDDLGWPYAGFMGDPLVRTPNLDALANQGTTFVNAQSPSSVCRPAMRALLAGIHTEQWDRQRSALVSAFGPLPLRSEVQLYRTVPRELVRRGYLAWEGGKMWEGSFAMAGFTHGLATSPSSVWSNVGDDFGRTGWTEGTALAPLEAFLDEAGERPFFLWVAPTLPHTPYDAPAEFTSLYAGLGLDPRVAQYYANTSWLDAVVGAVLDELERRGLREDTLVMFVSDNGMEATQPLAGVGRGKGTLYEIGFRQPIIVNWPGHVPAGVMRQDLVSTLDVAATVLDYGGADALDDGHGRSLREALETGAAVGEPVLVSRYGGAPVVNDGFWVRTPEWRYLSAADGREELYRIDLDPFEQTNLAPLLPDLVQGLRADFAGWQASLAAGRPEVDVAGRISDFFGAPVEGENLELTGRSRTGQRIRLSALASARGDFLFESVPLGSYTLKSRRTSARIALRGRLGRIPIALPPGSLDLFLPLQGSQRAAAVPAGDATLRGSVLDGAGAPLAGATVSMSGRASGRRVTVTVRTAADGTYRAEWLPAADYRVAASSAPPRPPVRATVTIGPGDDRVLDFTLPG